MAEFSNYIKDFLRSPENIKSIDEYDFLSVYNRVTNYIDNSAEITKVLLKANLNPLPHMIEVPDYSFMGLGIESIDIPDNIRRICVGAFSGCKNLKTVKLGSNVKFVERESFKDCINLTEIKFPKSIKHLYNDVFVNCDNLLKVYIPSGFVEEEKVDGLAEFLGLDPDKVELIFY